MTHDPDEEGEVEDETRKPVGVAMWPTSPDGAAEPVVVCDDGSVWASDFHDGNRRWRPLQPIPCTLADREAADAYRD